MGTRTIVKGTERRSVRIPMDSGTTRSTEDEFEILNYEENVRQSVVEETTTTKPGRSKTSDGADVAVISIGATLNGGPSHKRKITEISMATRNRRPQYVDNVSASINISSGMPAHHHDSLWDLWLHLRGAIWRSMLFFKLTVTSPNFWLIVFGLGYVCILALVVYCTIVHNYYSRR